MGKRGGCVALWVPFYFSLVFDHNSYSEMVLLFVAVLLTNLFNVVPLVLNASKFEVQIVKKPKIHIK